MKHKPVNFAQLVLLYKFQLNLINFTSVNPNYMIVQVGIKVTVDLQGYLPKNALFTRCFKENHGKLYTLYHCKANKL